MKSKECLYLLEGQPDLFAKFREFILTNDETNLPKFIKQAITTSQKQKRQAQIGALKLKQALTYIADYTKNNPGKQQRALSNLIAGNFFAGSKNQAGLLSLEGRAMAIIHEQHAKLAEAMSKYRPRKLGFDRSETAQRELIRALYGETKDVDAKAYGLMMSKVLDGLVDRYNAAGGDIVKLKTYRLPQYSDPNKMYKAGFKQWLKDIEGLLDNEEKIRQTRSRLGLSEGKPITNQQYEIAMRKAYDSLVTRGVSNVDPGKLHLAMRPTVSGRHQEHRFFHFKDADSWLKYHDMYGEGTPYAAIMGHIDRMSREIAAMETLGPNPERNLQFLIDTVRRDTGRSYAGNNVYAMYKDIMGELDGAQVPVVASMLRDARNIMAGTKLGAATISAISDTFFLGSTAKFNGISVVNTYKNFMSALNPANEADRVLAGKLGLSMDYALDKINQFNRISMVTGNNWSARFADFALRVNGLNHWTHAAEQAFGMEFTRAIGEFVGTSYSQLSKPFRSALQRYGITDLDWVKLSTTKRMLHEGVEHFTPLNIVDADLRAKVMGMISEETKMAVPSPNARVRSYIHQGQSTGTVAGEMFRSLGQFKSFPVTILVNQLGRRMSVDSIASRVAGISSMVVATTIIGALAYNLKEIAKGRTPLSWDSDAFWVNGMVQGGGLGLLGDVLFMDPNKRGSVTEFLAGPLVGEASRTTLDFVIRPFHQLAALELSAAAKGMAESGVDLAERTVPAPLNLPFVKLAIQRGVFDQLHRVTDDNWRLNQKRLRRELARERNQQLWWEP